ncbi:IST1 homolog isoform X1 [Coffea eugenioides]|uniref:IST1 homolog isoform X1 n=1 Tax=Coffea eugenioides TaxID=49369 RepID=UPI000F61045C|nr:IST1 homolog isoform X1 [Coffea eugenioides]XP_027148828.1 IST1 homolog isoform X1 [Coffea eugenioides]XP_027148830.1 IST1 homolog isoform X1 [Coffea eugenioides]
MDSFFSKGGFKASKCKTLLKLSIPRIKLLRNRREIQIKQMRRDIANLLETGQEATARIRVEHIIREEKMMAAQEIIELFCELIVVRLPIIEAQRECPIDLKEAISSLCFAAPRCADLQELLQVQMLFAAKYGKEFVAAATELRPECGVNRQLIELLSVRAPAPDVKLKLLKEIAEEHELDWDASASENELLKPHEDLLNGPTQFVSGSKVPLPKENIEEPLYAAGSGQSSGEQSDSDAGLDSLDFPEVPKQPLRSNTGDASAPQMLPFPASALSELEHESSRPTGTDEGLPEEFHLKPEKVIEQRSVTKEFESSPSHSSHSPEKQFVPFITPPSQTSTPFPVKKDEPSPSVSRPKSETNIDLQDVLAAAQAAAETAERAATAARAAASLAQVRISELVKQKSGVPDGNHENPFHAESEKSNFSEKPHLDHQSSLDDSDGVLRSPSPHHIDENHTGPRITPVPSSDDNKVDYDPFPSNVHVPNLGEANHQFQRLPSMDDDPSYPNLFTSQTSHFGSRANSFADHSRSTHEP